MRGTIGMEEEGDEDEEMNHVSKRARHNKGTIVVFDNADRTEYLSGFRKRKNKRRLVGQQQVLHKERQKRLQLRREKREALKAAKRDTQGFGEGGRAEDDRASQDGEVDISEGGLQDIFGTAVYEDTETTTVVRVTTIADSDEEDGENTHNSSHVGSLGKASFHAGAIKQNKTKPEKMKFKKPKKIPSEKRMKKLTRREKTMPKNLRSRRDKKRKK